MEKVVKKFSWFAEDEEAEQRYYASLTPKERMEIFFELLSQGQTDETEQRFEKVVRIVKLRES